MIYMYLAPSSPPTLVYPPPIYTQAPCLPTTIGFKCTHIATTTGRTLLMDQCAWAIYYVLRRSYYVRTWKVLRVHVKLLRAREKFKKIIQVPLEVP